MSTLQLDRTDSGVEEMVSAWKNGGEYDLYLKVRQTGATDKTATFDVIEAIDESLEESDEEPEGEYPADKPKPKGKGKMGKPALMISFGP